MNWSVSASGKALEVKSSIEAQFCAADATAECESERATMRLVLATIIQVLGTFDADKSVEVSACKNMALDDPPACAGHRPVVVLSIWEA